MARMDAGALREFLDREFPQVKDMFAVTAAGEGCATLRLVPGPAHLRPGGTVSGPTIFALADVAAYLALLTRIGPVALAVTTNCSIDFMRKPPEGAALTCEARVLKLGRSLAVLDAFVHAEGVEGPVARAGLTYAIPPGPAPE